MHTQIFIGFLLRFHVLVDTKENFPFVRRKGLQIKTGHLKLIGLSATKIDAGRSIYSVEPKKRKCRFDDERENLIFHENYIFRRNVVNWKGR